MAKVKDTNLFLDFLTKDKDVPIPWNKIKSICIFSRNAIGENIRIFGIFEALKKKYPHVKITFVCPEYISDLIIKNPFIDNFIFLDKETLSHKSFSKNLKLIKKLKALNFDASISLELYSSIVSFLSRISFRIGIETSLFVHRRKKENFIDRKSYDDFLEELLGVDVGKSGRVIYLDEKVVKDKNRIGICLGFEGDVRNWSLDGYLDVIRHVNKKHHGKTFVFFGGEDGEPLLLKLLKKIGKSSSVKNFVGKTTLKETCLEMKKCAFVLSHDCGPMHMAIASKVKTICFFGDVPTPPEPVLPTNKKNIFLFHDERGASFITSKKVIKKIEELLK